MFNVVIMQGVSGAGKSTVARQLIVGRPFARIVSADDYHTREGVYKCDPTKHGEAHNQCMRMFIEAAQDKMHLIVVDNVNARELNIAPYMAVAEAYGYDATILRVVCDPNVAHARNIHGVPQENIVRWSADIFGRSLPPWWRVKAYNADLATVESTMGEVLA